MSKNFFENTKVLHRDNVTSDANGLNLDELASKPKPGPLSDYDRNFDKYDRTNDNELSQHFDAAQIRNKVLSDMRPEIDRKVLQEISERLDKKAAPIFLKK